MDAAYLLTRIGEFMKHNIIQNRDKYLIQFEYEAQTKYIYCHPIYEDGPQYHDKFSFMEKPPQLLSFEIYPISEEQYRITQNKYIEFGVIDMRPFMLHFHLNIKPEFLNLNEESFYKMVMNSVIMHMYNGDSIKEIKAHVQLEEIAKEVFPYFKEEIEQITEKYCMSANSYNGNWGCITLFLRTDLNLQEFKCSGKAKQLNDRFYAKAKLYDKKNIVPEKYEFLHFDSYEYLKTVCNDDFHLYFS